jgi:hypothetical protein
MNGPPSLVARLGIAACVATLSACSLFTKAAAKDPMQCERDPACAKYRSYIDCSKQCVDDPECTDRCKSVQNPAVGHQ